ncbi:polysaccharide deacetylase family protein [Algoriphagus marinus]|uniref:polysaccharide deacetylase family protein n=1 Tax=Algoriphagus marinus TaxID=1925762 RepID=UPI00094BBF02|nr:polysaccharide deacetylase family protein [Algoriphagus marinus]
MFFHRVPAIVQRLYPNRTWNNKDAEGKVYLTFDDGPVPGVTEFALDQLAKHGMKATFFMVGDNVRKYPELAKEVIAAGHQFGNHTYHHLKGWRTKLEYYFDNFQKCEEIFEQVIGQKSRLFRPPYGLMTGRQMRKISESHQIIMWNVLSGDYDPTLKSDKILENIKKLTDSGAIILFHDQKKTAEVLPKLLPQYLDFVQQSGFETALL